MEILNEINKNLGRVQYIKTSRMTKVNIYFS